MQKMMRHTFEPSINIYWSRALTVIAVVVAFALLPMILPTASDSSGFMIGVTAIGVITLAVLVYVRPKRLTLSISQVGVVVANQSQRILEAIS